LLRSGCNVGIAGIQAGPVIGVLSEPAVGHLGFSAPLGTRSFGFAHSAFSVGMIVSTLLGLVTIALGKLSIGLGTAGGFSSSALATRARSPVP